MSTASRGIAGVEDAGGSADVEDAAAAAVGLITGIEAEVSCTVQDDTGRYSIQSTVVQYSTGQWSER
jgi:hypothetical protein